MKVARRMIPQHWVRMGEAGRIMPRDSGNVLPRLCVKVTIFRDQQPWRRYYRLMSAILVNYSDKR